MLVITKIISMRKDRKSRVRMLVRAISLKISRLGNSNTRISINNKKDFNNKRVFRMFSKKKKKFSNHREINQLIILKCLKN